MSRKRIKQYLMLLTVVGLIAVAANGSGTFASFNAVVGNAGNTFATGSLLLNEAISGDHVVGTTCDSNDGTANGNSNSSCTSKISLTNSKPGDSTTDTFTLTNTGTIVAAGGLNLSSAGCTNSNDSTASLGFNTGNLCNAIRAYVELDDSAGTPVKCIYPAGAGACDTTFASSSDTLGDLANTFLATPANDALLSSVPAATTEGQANAGSPSTNVYKVVVGLKLPNNATAGADNVYQDVSSTFPLTWTLNQ